jgi:hypothetical protein
LKGFFLTDTTCSADACASANSFSSKPGAVCKEDRKPDGKSEAYDIYLIVSKLIPAA